VQFSGAFGCVDHKLNKDDDFCNGFANAVHFATWHQRVGHMSHSKMRTISKFMQLQHNEKGFICDICPEAKQHRLSFPASHISSTCVFELRYRYMETIPFQDSLGT